MPIKLDYPNKTLQTYFELVLADKDGDYPQEEQDRINAILRPLWPILRQRVAPFSCAFEEWVKACIEKTHMRTELPGYMPFQVYKTADSEKYDDLIWEGGDNDCDHLPAELRKAIEEVLLPLYKRLWLAQITDFAYAKQMNTWELLAEDFESLIRSSKDVRAYYNVEYYEAEGHRDLFFIDDGDFNNLDVAVLREEWELVKDLLPEDVACLLEPYCDEL